MSADIQPTFTVNFVEDRSRLSTFFRIVMVIPLMIVGYFYAIGAMFAVFFAWLAVSFTGRYPAGLYDFLRRFLRWQTSVNSYYFLLTDDYPSFSLSDDAQASYPVQLTIGPAKDAYGRLHAFLRLFAAIPVFIIAYAMSLVASIGVLCSWFVIVITGKQIKGLQEFTELGLSYIARMAPYVYLLTEKWPTLMNPDGALPPATPATPIEPAPAAAPAASTPAPVETPAQPAPPNPFGD